MEHLIAYLYRVERDRSAGWLVGHYMTEAGFSEAEINKAWSEASGAGLTRFSGLGQDRLSSLGRAKAPKLAALLEKAANDPPGQDV